MEETAAADKGSVLYRYRFGSAEYDALRRELRVGGIVVDLEPKPMEVLAFLLEHAGEAVSREQLLDTVWGRRPAIDNLVANTVLKLRRALGPDNAQRIVTLPRIGFRIDEPVERIAVGRQRPGALDFRPGAQVPMRPHWVLERRLGLPGGNEVWLARQTKTGRLQVFKFAGDGSRLSALKREVTLYRLLSRALPATDGFVEIVDWNFSDPPFFVEAEYAGENLADWAAQDARLAKMPAPDRIALFLRIADAVSAAHGAGVLHKDLKPTNVLVHERDGGELDVRLTDFGSARLLESERLAEMGITVMGLTREFGSASSGTPVYMAPELIAGGSPTLQSDLYSLGVMLYQMLAGDLSRPLAAGWERDIADPLLREDIAGAVHGDPAQRLGSVTQLIERLRTLDARRVQNQERQRREAEAEALAAQVARAKARRPLLVATVCVLIAGLIASFGFYLRSEAALREANRQNARADAINRFLTDDLLGAANPQRGAQTSDPPISEVLAVAEQQLEKRFADDPFVKAAVHLAIGQAHTGSANFPAALAQREKAEALLEHAVAPDHPLLLRARYDRALSLCALSRFDEGLAALDTLDPQATRAREADFRLDIAAELARANCHHLRIQPDEAVPPFERALKRLETMAPDDFQQRIAISRALADNYTRTGRYEDGERMARDLLAMDPTVISPVQRGMAGLVLGTNLLARGRNEEAVSTFERAHAELEEAVGPDNRFTLTALSHLGNAHSALGNWPKVVETQLKAWEGFRRTAGDDAPSTQSLLANVGIAQFMARQYADALASLEKAHATLVPKFGQDSAIAQMTAYYLASALAEHGRYAEAGRLAANLDAKILKAASPGSIWDAQLQGLRGQVLSQDDPEAAISMLREAVQTLESEAANQPWHAERLRASLARLEGRR